MITFYNKRKFDKNVQSDGIAEAVLRVIREHRASVEVKTAKDADEYFARRNVTINQFIPYYYDLMGNKRADEFKPNNHLCNNYFNYLINQRVNFSLGDGISFDEESTLEKLGKDFNEKMSETGRSALVHGVAFQFYDVDHIHVFKFTEFAPIQDYKTSAIVGGVRYWQVDDDSPLYAVLYEEDGFTELSNDNDGEVFQIDKEKRSYKVTVQKEAGSDEEIIVGAENYTTIPIFPYWGSRNHQSELVGMRGELDAIDLGMSGFVNNMTDVQNLLTIINGYDGMNEEDLIRLRTWMRTQGIIQADEGSISTQQISEDVNGRVAFLAELKDFTFEQFGGLDVHTIMAGQTNDHISASYEPLNAQADNFEDCMTNGMRPLLEMLGIDDAPAYNRKMVANQTEIIQAVLTEFQSQLIDKETALKKLPNIDNEEIEAILNKLDEEESRRFNQAMAQQQLQAEMMNPNPEEENEEIDEDEE